MRRAWMSAVVRAAGVAELVEVDLSAFMAAAELLYTGPLVAERYAAVGAFLERAGPDVDPAVRRIVLGGAAPSAADAFRGAYRLAELRRETEAVLDDVDALLVPTAPRHPTHAAVAADPVAVNAQLGVWTNFVNLLDLAAVAVPAASRDDGLPFGVTFVAPAWSDAALLRLAETWERSDRETVDVAVVGAHLSGMTRNHELVGLGGHADGAGLPPLPTCSQVPPPSAEAARPRLPFPPRRRERVRGHRIPTRHSIRGGIARR